MSFGAEYNGKRCWDFVSSLWDGHFVDPILRPTQDSLNVTKSQGFPCYPPPNTGWVEESFTNFDKGINWRSYVVSAIADAPAAQFSSSCCSVLQLPLLSSPAPATHFSCFCCSVLLLLSCTVPISWFLCFLVILLLQLSFPDSAIKFFCNLVILLLLFSSSASASQFYCFFYSALLTLLLTAPAIIFFWYLILLLLLLSSLVSASQYHVLDYQLSCYSVLLFLRSPLPATQFSCHSVSATLF